MHNIVLPSVTHRRVDIQNFLCFQVIRRYNNEAQTSSGFHSNYDLQYMVTPQSKDQYVNTIKKIQQAAGGDLNSFKLVSSIVFIQDCLPGRGGGNEGGTWITETAQSVEQLKSEA